MAKKTAGIYRKEKFEFESINRLMYFGYDKDGDRCSSVTIQAKTIAIFLSISVQTLLVSALL
jgi:hypothetical protein